MGNLPWVKLAFIYSSSPDLVSGINVKLQKIAINFLF